jgi:hypothetical protein
MLGVQMLLGTTGKPAPGAQNLLLFLIALGAWVAYRSGIGPTSRRRARAGFVLSAGMWGYFVWGDGTVQRPTWPPTSQTVFAAIAIVLGAWLLATRLRRRARGTWKPDRKFFIVEDDGKWYR